MSLRRRRLLGFAVGVLWLGVAGWILVFATTLAGVSIDPGATPVAGWWWMSIAVAILTIIGGRFWPILVISVVGGVALIVHIDAARAGSSPDIVTSLDSIAALAAVPTGLSLIGLAGHVDARATKTGTGAPVAKVSSPQP
jgi:hypothetical protein